MEDANGNSPNQELSRRKITVHTYRSAEPVTAKKPFAKHYQRLARLKAGGDGFGQPDVQRDGLSSIISIDSIIRGACIQLKA